MSGADYLLCDNCDGKAAYDPGLDLNVPTYGELVILCRTCSDSGYRIVVYDSTTTLVPITRTQEGPS